MSTMSDTDYRNKPCEERIENEMRDRLEDMAAILRREERACATNNEDRRDSNFEEWNNYPLSVSKSTLVTVQLSWGGPSDEFEVEIDEEREVVAIRYRFKDWFDGAMRELQPGSREFETAERFLSYFTEIV